jgi:putative tricarboxylic transport membrane protein
MVAEFVQGFLWLGIGIAVLYFSTEYNMGSLTEPGPGALPFTVGLIFVVLSSILIIRTWHKKGSGVEKPVPFGPRYRKVFLILVFFAIDTFFIESLGYILAVFLLIIVPMFLIEPKRWVSILLLGGVASVASYVLFDHWLGLTLPRGLFPF